MAVMNVFLVGRDPLCLCDEFARDGEHGDQWLLECDLDPATPVATRRNELVDEFLKLPNQLVICFPHKQQQLTLHV